jgi:hypothetical protein
VKRDEQHQPPIIAPLNTLQQRSIAAPGLLAQIIVAKESTHKSTCAKPSPACPGFMTMI